MISAKDAIGERAENIFVVKLTEFHGEKPLFHPATLGDKWPSTDFLVEVEDHDAFFFVQIKGTREGYNSKGRLKVGLDDGTAERLTRKPAPTYVVGVDVDKERAYLVSANAKTVGGFSSLSTEFSINDPVVRQALRDEVIAFWARFPKTLDSTFIDPEWR